jgi:hypothetical protein
MRQAESSQHAMHTPLSHKGPVAKVSTEIGSFHSKQRLVRVDMIPVNRVRDGTIHASSKDKCRLSLGTNSPGACKIDKHGTIHGRNGCIVKICVHLVTAFIVHLLPQLRVHVDIQIKNLFESTLHRESVHIHVEKLNSLIILCHEPGAHLLDRFWFGQGDNDIFSEPGVGVDV